MKQAEDSDVSQHDDSVASWNQSNPESDDQDDALKQLRVMYSNSNQNSANKLNTRRPNDQQLTTQQQLNQD